MRGNAPEAASGPEIDVPSVTRLRAVASAWPMTAFSHVSSAIFSACGRGRPFGGSGCSVEARD